MTGTGGRGGGDDHGDAHGVALGDAHGVALGDAHGAAHGAAHGGAHGAAHGGAQDVAHGGAQDVAHGGAQDVAQGTHWAPGEQILWRYRDHAPGLKGPVHICRPVTVVQDTPELLAVWMAPGTECVKPVLADGTSVHAEPLATRYTAPRTTVRSRWSGTGVLKLARPGDPWSVWLFWERGWQFKNWYVNLEAPRSRWTGGVDSEDHFLDIAVHPDRSWKWLDEDEFAEAQRSGLMDREQARRVRDAGRAAVDVIRAWGPPFSDGWQDWRPDPRWGVPVLPEDWDRTPAHMTS